MREKYTQSPGEFFCFAKFIINFTVLRTPGNPGFHGRRSRFCKCDKRIPRLDRCFSIQGGDNGRYIHNFGCGRHLTFKNGENACPQTQVLAERA